MKSDEDTVYKCSERGICAGEYSINSSPVAFILVLFSSCWLMNKTIHKTHIMYKTSRSESSGGGGAALRQVVVHILLCLGTLEVFLLYQNVDAFLDDVHPRFKPQTDLIENLSY